MAFTLPVIDPCCVEICTDPTVVQVPGPKGDTGDQGPAGSAGVAGKNAYTTLTAPFTMPAEGASAQASVVNTGWMVVGQVVYVQGLGYLRVVSIDSSLLVTLMNLANTATSQYLMNAAPGTVSSGIARVGPGGEQGISGVAFSNVDENDTDDPPSDPTRGALRYPTGSGILRQWIVGSQSWST